MDEYPLKPMNPHPDAVKRWERLEELTEKIGELAAHIEAATYRLLLLIREFDKLGGWDDGSTRSCAHWLNWRIGLDLGTAREKVRVARALEDLPLISEALRKGTISYSKVRAMTRVATPENEKSLLNIAECGTASHVEKVVRAWRNLDGIHERKHADKQNERRSLTTYADEDGMLVLKARLTPEMGAVVLRALDAAQEALYKKSVSKNGKDVSAETSTWYEEPREHRRADALGLVAESALENGLDPGTRGDRYQVVVHVDENVLADPNEPGQSVLEDGLWISADTSRRLACDAAKVEMRELEDGTLLDLGRKTRVVSAALRRALEARDRKCRFPACNATVKVCDTHHLEHWANGGKTNLTNCYLLCAHHHRCVHEGGYTMELLPNGQLQFYWPTGQPIPEVLPFPPLGEDPVADLQTQNVEEGLDITPKTITPVWDGDRLDLDWVMSIIYRPPEDTSLPN